MTVIAKFYVSEIERHENSPTASKITLGAVCRGIENSEWASATPGGNIVLYSLNESATEQFVKGEEYLIHFTRSPKPQPGDGHQVSAVKTKYGSYVCATCGGYPNMAAGVRYDQASLTDLDWSAHNEMFDSTS